MALAIGVGGGMAPRFLAAEMNSGYAPLVPPAKPAEVAPLEVLDLVGTVKQGQGSSERSLRPGGRVEWPARIRVEGLGSEARLASGSLRMELSQETDVVISPLPKETDVLLEDGLVVLISNRPVHVHVPKYYMEVVGQAFGVWVREDSMQISVLDGEVSLLSFDAEPARFGKGREIVVTADAVTPRDMNETLSISEISRSKVSPTRFRVSAEVVPNAVVLLQGVQERQEVKRSASGKISATIDTDETAPVRLFAYDSAGRRTELGGQPATLQEVLDRLRK
jgi:hypothetical protein